jgi:DNA-binding FadR family transcriptional regulator
MTEKAAGRQVKRAEAIAREIVGDIVREGLPKGHRLPPEPALLEKYAVSRESLREAQRILEVNGLIHMQMGRGGGTVVGETSPGSLGKVSTLHYMFAGCTYGELFDACIRTQGWVAECAAASGTRETRSAALQTYRAERQAELEAAQPAHADPPYRFHDSLARITGNRVLELLLLSISRVLDSHFVHNVDPHAIEAAAEHDHELIAAAVLAGDATEARAQMERHTRAITSYYIEMTGVSLDRVIQWF